MQKYCILADLFLSFQLEENCKNFSLNNCCHAQLVPYYLNSSWMHQLATSLSSQPQEKPWRRFTCEICFNTSDPNFGKYLCSNPYIYVCFAGATSVSSMGSGASIHVFVWIVSEQLEGAMSNHNVYCQGLFPLESSPLKIVFTNPTRSSCSVSISFDPGLQR